jgi:hypothetical protein
MDLLSVILATAIALGSTGGSTTEAGSHIIDLGSTTSSETEPSDNTEARSHIIDLG